MRRISDASSYVEVELIERNGDDRYGLGDDLREEDLWNAGYHFQPGQKNKSWTVLGKESAQLE